MRGVVAYILARKAAKNYTDAAADAAKPHEGAISLGTTWTGESGTYYQSVTPVGVTITADSTVFMTGGNWLNDMAEAGAVSVWLDNVDGVLTVYATTNGNAPNNATLEIGIKVWLHTVPATEAET